MKKLLSIFLVFSVLLVIGSAESIPPSPSDSDLTAIAGLTVAQGKFIIGSATPAWSLSAYTFPISATLGDLWYVSAANTLSGLAKGANNTFLGINGSGVFGYYTNISLDDSAAQFYNAAAPTKLVGIDASGMTAGVTAWWKPVASTGPVYFTNSSVTAGTYTLVTTTGTDTLTNKTLTAPAVTFPEVDGSATGSLSAANVSRSFINSYGRGAAATLTLPAAATGYTFVAIVGTQHNSAWKIQRAGTDTIYWDAGGVLTAGKTYFQETNQVVGSRVSCATFRTGASAWSWICGSVSGTWQTD